MRCRNERGPLVDPEFVPIAQEKLVIEKTGSGTAASTITAPSPGPEFIPLECGATCEAQYNEGTKVTLSEEHSERTAFEGWSGCAHESGPKCEVTMTESKTVKAKFTAIPQEKLAASTEGPGTLTGTSPGPEFTPLECGTTCEAEYDQGGQIVLIASHSERSTFEGWSGACSGPEPTCEVEMSAAKSVKAKFTAIPQQKLTAVTTDGSGEGTLTGSQPGPEFTPISCGHGPLTCEAEYNQGAKITLTAAPTERSVFEGWSGACTGAEPTCEVEMSAAETVKAKFTEKAQEELTLTVEGSGQGTLTGTSPGPEFTPIDCGNGAETCAEKYDQGATVTLIAPTPNERTTFTSWSGCTQESGTTCEVEMSAAKSVKAKFTAIPSRS